MPNTDTLINALARLESWLETMRCAGGYGGPVAHWWQQSLLYTGPGLDWRYEGIIIGYLHLWERTQNEKWLQKARRAGDDLVQGQLANGHYPASNFELNPASGGTPHEVAADVGLLQLALTLRILHLAEDGEVYARAAEKNLQTYYLDRLWDEEARAFRDHPLVPSFVPNKAATAVEAFMLLAQWTQQEAWAERYALPNLDRILEHQVQDAGAFHGAIVQNSFGSRKVEKYFPKYIARCVPALVQGYEWTGSARYADAAVAAMSFIGRHLREEGSLPTVIYGNGRMNLWPSWIAPLADVLRAAAAVQPLGVTFPMTRILERMLSFQDASGGIQTARGFSAQAGGRPALLPDMRDVLHVVGWNDKVFRYLASQVEGPLPEDVLSGEFEQAVVFRGQRMTFLETLEEVSVTKGKRVVYRWRKGDLWADVAEEIFWLR